jgi:hypothetical protein
MTRVFELYASGVYSLKALTVTAYGIGLRHSRSDRKMTKSELHRLLKNPSMWGTFGGSARSTVAPMSHSLRETRSSAFRP